MEEQALANQISELRRETMVIPTPEKKSPVCIDSQKFISLWKLKTVTMLLVFGYYFLQEMVKNSRYVRYLYYRTFQLFAMTKQIKMMKTTTMNLETRV